MTNQVFRSAGMKMAGKNRARGTPEAGKPNAETTDGRGRRRSALSYLRIWQRRLKRSNLYSGALQYRHSIKEAGPAAGREAANRAAELEAVVSRLKEGTEQLQQTEARYRIISELISDFAYVARLEPPGRFVIEWISEQASRIFGYQVDKFSTSEQWMDIAHPDD